MHHFPQMLPELPKTQRNPFDDTSKDPFLAKMQMDEIFNHENSNKVAYTELFNSLRPVEGKLSGSAVRPAMESSGKQLLLFFISLLLWILFFLFAFVIH